MALSIVALFVYIFGAYAYGYLLFLLLQRREERAACDVDHRRLSRALFRMFALCAVWFLLHAVIEFRVLLGAPQERGLLSLMTLELVLLFPAVIFHTYFLESVVDIGLAAHRTRWRAAVWILYASGLAFAAYFTAAIFRLLPQPPAFGRTIGIVIGSLFIVMSVCVLLVRRQHPPASATPDQKRLVKAINILFAVMIGQFVAMNVVQETSWMFDAVMLAGRSTPLAFLLVSVYYENRIEFYDLVIKRGVLLVMSVVLTGAVLALSLGSVSDLPDGPARPWIFAVLLLPLAMVMPWLHDRVGRLLDRWWFGREFTPIEAVKHVLGAMQQAADEPALINATETSLSEIFRRPIAIVAGRRPIAGDTSVVVDIGTVSPDAPVRLAAVPEAGARAMLSEDVTLLRSLGGVFGYMLENVRLQRKRQEQEQLAQELRLQSSRSELKALRAQINPHFLFNALNAIASLIHTDPARADAAVEQLAEVFRYTLRRSDQEWAPLDQELAFARAYLDVEQARFGRRLQYAIQADDAVMRAHIPSMLLQTLVENAVKHGISRLRSPGRIEIAAARANGRVILEVRDTGPGPATASDGAATTGESFGLRSVRDRLRGHFGGNATLDLRRDASVTVARIEMPAIEDLSLAAGATR
jgi:signal transduction histidine kinase